MTKTKVLAGFLLVLAVLFAQVGSAAAAPQIQSGTTTVSGKVVEIGTPQTQNGITTVLVTLEATDGTKTTVRVSEAVAAGLTLNETATLTVSASDVVPPEQEDVHPVAELLGSFFNVSAGEVNQFHQEDGFGFGVIAQALWMARDKDGNTDIDLANAILTAKKTGDYTEITKQLNLTEAPANWGQLKKALKAHSSVGQAKQKNSENEDSSQPQNQGKGQGNEKKDNNGKSDNNPGKGKGHNKP